MSDPREVTLDATEARRQTAARNRYLNLVVYPQARLVGNVLVLAGVALHNAFILESFSSSGFVALAAGALLYSLASWLALRLWYGAITAVDLGMAFTVADVVVWTFMIYASGAERSWLFFLMLIRAADQRFAGVRRIVAFGSFSVGCYAAMLAYVALVDGRPLPWGRALTTLFFLTATNLYIAITARTAEIMRARLVSAIRVARQANERHEEALATLSASEARYRDLFENAHDPMVAFAGDGTILDANRATVEATGYARDELVGASLAKLVSPEEAMRSMGNIARMMAGENVPQRELLEVRTKDGRIVFVEPRTQIIRDRTGKPVAMLGIYREITDRVQAELVLRDAKEAAEAASRAKSQFLASMSHELRTPLNSVIGFSKVLLNRTDGELTETQALYIKTMHENSTHLLRLIDEILDIARIEAGKTELVREDVRFDTLVEECLQASRPLLADKPVTLDGTIERDVPVIAADRTKLKQVLLNLLGNASKFTAYGRVSVTVRATPDAVQVSVSDTGRGIPPAELPWIFDPFRQVPVPGRATSGIGLGLAICKKFVELHDGHIWVESTEFRGSTFHFTVPYDRAERGGSK